MSNPWDRQRKDDELEPALWFSRFTLYRNMGPERTLLGAVNEAVNKGKKRQTFIPGSWSRKSKKWNWQTRAEAFDAAELARKEILFRERCDAWTAGRFDDAELIRRKARDMLAFPVSQRTGTDEQGYKYIVEPLDPAQAKAATAMLKTADELARITTRETLPKTELEIKDWRAIAKEHGIDPDELYSNVFKELTPDDERGNAEGD